MCRVVAGCQEEGRVCLVLQRKCIDIVVCSLVYEPAQVEVFLPWHDFLQPNTAHKELKQCFLLQIQEKTETTAS